MECYEGFEKNRERERAEEAMVEKKK